jgi:hypothetical protein
MLPALVSVPMQLHAMHEGMPPNPAISAWIYAASMLLGLLLVPLYAGYIQLINAAEHGLPARIRDIFRPYGRGDAWRLIGYGLVLMVIYVAFVGLVVVTAGSGIVHWYIELVTAQANHQLPATGLPDGFGTAIALFVVVWIFMIGVHAIGLGQIALRERSVFGAIGDGLLGALKNLLPLLLFAVSLVLAMVAAVIIFALVAMLLVLLGKLVGIWLVLVLLIPLYIAMLLMMFATIYGVMYHLWRDVCGDDTAADLTPALAA